MKSVELQDLCFSYGEQTINTLNHINFSANQGECILVCGASGCGKSTLLQTINGIIPEQKEGNLSGTVLINGKDGKTLLVKEKSVDIGSVFQNPKSQFFHLNTTDELFFGAANHLVPLEEMENRLNKVVRDFDIEHLVNRNIFMLSGGEKQRIACASVAMNKPNIYVLDEPSSNLDEESIEKLRDILAVLKSQGATIIIAEHRLYYALEICDKVIYMKDGEILNTYSRESFLEIPNDKRKAMGLRSFTCKSMDELKALVPNNTNEPALKIEHLDVKYGKHLAISIKELALPLNKIIAITGKNGAGKSSFVRAFVGLHKVKKALLDGKPLKPKVQQKNSFMVMQDVNSQLYCESVIDELIQLTDESEEIKAEARKVLDKLNLLEFEEAHPMILSGGQKQRLAIATALFLNKRYLIFDEPTSGLDYDNMLRVSGILKELKDKVDLILVITHDKELIENSADYMIDFNKD